MLHGTAQEQNGEHKPHLCVNAGGGVFVINPYP